MTMVHVSNPDKTNTSTTTSPECSTQSCKRDNQEAVALRIVSKAI